MGMKSPFSMTNYTLLTIACLLLLAGVLVFGLWRHKRSGRNRVELLGAAGVVQSELNPEGAVLIHGELWSARSTSESKWLKSQDTYCS
jgi:membrane-bound ClpP family serine protease